MKKFTSAVILFFLFVFTFNTARANYGNSCSNPVFLTTFHPKTDSLSVDSFKWYSFVDTGTTIAIVVPTLSGSGGHIHAIFLYDSCGGHILSFDSSGSDSLIVNNIFMVTGRTYYLKIVSDNAGKAKYVVSFQGPPAALSTCAYTYSVTGCGINYTYSSIPLHGRYNPTSAPDAQTIPLGPGVFTITMPPGVTIVKAFVLYAIININPSSYAPGFTLNSTVYNTSKGVTLCGYYPAGSTGWNGDGAGDYYYVGYAPGGTNPYNSIFGYYNVEGNTESYYTDVTSTITSSGTYTITGLPQYDNSLPPNITSNFDDVDGATLVVVYQDCAPYYGTFVLQNNFYMTNIPETYSLTVPSPPSGSQGSAFFIVADEQQGGPTGDQYAIGLGTPPIAPYTAYITPDPSLWNTETVNFNPFNSPNVYSYINTAASPRDVYDMIAMGAYYQYSDNSCAAFDAPKLAGPVFACGTPPYTYTVKNPEAGVNYTWSVTNSSSNTISYSSPGTMATATFSVLPAIIKCVATDGGCSLTITYTVNPCCATATYYITNKSASQIGSGYTNATVLINGTFTVDQNFAFNGCDVKFTPNSSIIINSGYTLAITPSLTNCSHLYAGCDAMWNGIFINPGGTLSVDGSSGIGGGVLIEDAKNAVVVNPSSSPGGYTLNEVIFNKDYQDIVIHHTSATYGGSATNCIFTCRNITSSISNCTNYYADWQTAAATTISLAPDNGKITYSGIFIDTVSLYSNFTGCYFDNIEYGVDAQRSSLGVYGNTFQNISTGNSNGNYAGVLVQNCLTCSAYNSLVVGGSSYWQWNTFTNCNIGVAVAYTNYVTIDYNEFDNSGAGDPPFAYAIDQVEETLNSGRGTVSIHSNKIYNAIVGIRAYNNINTRAEIACNIISDPNCTGYNYTGINVTELRQNYNADYGINNNTISSPNYGIVVNNTYAAVIGDNGINLGYGSGTCSGIIGTGIQSNGSINNGILCANSVTGVPSISNNYTGMSESQCTLTEFYNNFTTNLYHHILFDGSTYTGDNAFENHLTSGYTGIITNGNAMDFLGIGEKSMEARNTFSSLTCEVNTPQYLVPYFCNTNCPTSCTTPLDNYLASTWPPLGCVIGSIYCPELIPKSIAHSVISGSDSLMYLLMDSVAITPYRVTPDSTTIAYMESIALNHDTFPDFQDTDIALAKEGVTRVLWLNQGLLTSYTILHNFNDSISATPMGEIMLIDTTIWSASPTTYPTLLTSLNAIVPVNNIEANLQTAAWGHLNYLISNDSLTPAQISTMRVLANKCPDWDGDAVYQARALLSKYDSAGTIYSDSCSLSGHRPERRTKANQTQAIYPIVSIYPNPNNGNFTLEYNIGTDKNGTIRLYNMTGQMVGEYMLNNSDGKMSISNPELSNGIYIWKIYTDSNATKIGKVIIIK